MTQTWPPILEQLDWRGEYNGDAYDADSLVTLDGSAYRATVDLAAGVTPGEDDRWAPVALGGVDGIDASFAGEVGKSIPFVDLTLDAGFSTPVDTPAAQVGMDLGGVVWMRGQILPAGAGTLATFATLLDLALRPDRRVRVPVCKVNGDVVHLIVEPDGTMKITTTVGDVFHIDTAFPSGVAFGDARSRDLQLGTGVVDDPDSPLRAIGSKIVGAVQSFGVPVDGLATLAADPPEGENWHFEGSGTYLVVNGLSAGQTGTLTVNDDDIITIQSYDPIIDNPGTIRYVFPGLTITP